MQYTRAFGLLLVALNLPNSITAQAISTPTVPRQMYYACHNDDYTVKVRSAGSAQWTDLYEYNVKVDMDTHSNASMVQFDFTDRVEVMVKLNNGTLNTAQIRPLHHGITPQIQGNIITFSLDRPHNLSLECNGDRLHNLHIFAQAPQTNIPDTTSSNVMYFAPGYHEPKTADKTFRVPSNTTVYLAPGAVLTGALNCDSTQNVRICGRGMIWKAQNGIKAGWADNLTVEDITVVNPRYNTITVGAAKNTVISGLKSFSDMGWGDGIDLFCTQNVTIKDCFLRNSDDCIAIYAHRWDYYGNTTNINVENCTLWADIAHPINIGTHGNTTTQGEEISQVRFENIDILEHDEDDRDYQGALTVNAGDKNWIHHITFNNIRVESIQEGQLFHLRVMDLPKYCTAPGRHVEHITFSNISYNGQGENPSVIHGYSPDGMVRDITFQNITINGKKAQTLQDLNLDMGAHTRNIKLR